MLVGMALKALLFDFDGLILDTETPEVEQWKVVFHDHGVTFPREYFAWAVGRGAEQIQKRPIDLLLEKLTEPVEPAVIEAEYNEKRMAAINAQPPREGIIVLLEQAREEGIRLAVVSSSRHRWVDGHLARLGLDHFFERTVCADDVAHAKPFPDLYLKALTDMEVAADEAVVLEDSPNGARAGHAAGIAVVVVPNPMTRALDFDHHRARYESFLDLTLHDLRALVR